MLLLAVRLVLVDDNPAMLETLAEMVQRDFTIVGKFSSPVPMPAEIGGLNPDIILLDVSLGDMTGFYVAKTLKRMECAAKIIFVSVHENPDFVRAAFELGAAGYVYKSQISSDLLEALDAVSRGGRFVPCSSSAPNELIL
jgi:DNA-binding NarL/FixJ family response regulator